MDGGDSRRESCIKKRHMLCQKRRIICQMTHEYVENEKLMEETRGVRPVSKRDICCAKTDLSKEKHESCPKRNMKARKM